jgi:hypothetical protein
MRCSKPPIYSICVRIDRSQARTAFLSAIPSAGGVLLRHQPDPGRKTAPGGESLPVADRGNQCGSGDRADAWDLRQPPARLTLWHLDAAEWAPSTASFADIGRA